MHATLQLPRGGESGPWCRPLRMRRAELSPDGVSFGRAAMRPWK